MNPFGIDQKCGDVIGPEEPVDYLNGVGVEAGRTSPAAGHEHHARTETDDETSVALPAAVLRRLRAGVQSREVCLHQLSGRVVLQAGEKVTECAGAEMVAGFASPEFDAGERDLVIFGRPACGTVWDTAP